MSKTERSFKPLSFADGMTIGSELIIADYRLAVKSRHASVIGRKEVVPLGRAKFGIFGDGKEVAQLAMARCFKNGDWRSGYYRDQTLMLATGMLTLPQFFAQLYADSDPTREPATAGRQMGSHFSTRYLDSSGDWMDQLAMKNTAADLSPTAGQMVKTVGLAYASKLYRNNPALGPSAKGFSDRGNEIVFATIGNASTSEGPFLETVNAAGVLQVPLLISVWDDGYGISVPNESQTTKSSISAALAGFQRTDDAPGIEIYTVKGWDYPALCEVYATASAKVRAGHVPALVHVMDMTQPLGHSTSGSHERYKPKGRLQFETDMDPIKKMREWMVSQQIATDEQLDEWEAEDRSEVEVIRKAAFEDYQEPMKKEQQWALNLIKEAASASSGVDISAVIENLENPSELNRALIHSCMARTLESLRLERSDAKAKLQQEAANYLATNEERYRSHLFSTSNDSPMNIAAKEPTYSDGSETVAGSVVLVRCFDHHFKKDARLFVVGEDVGKLGDVNKVFDGLFEKYGEMRLTDTGIREATILGQGIGAAMRGLRPIVDIQYLDYLLYALQGMSDDLATLRYRSAGGQKAPVIIRSKGHRLQGIWHTGSPMGMIINACRGIHVAVPRDMTRAAGFYNTLLRGDDPALVIEVLSGYYIREKVPDNVGTFTVPLGVPEVLRQGSDLTVVTYGASCRLSLEAAKRLGEMDIDAEIIDIQTLLPFDINHTIVKSLEKTNAVVFLDEDVPGGASAFMMQKVLEDQSGWQWLDTPPRTLTATENRSAFATDGLYFTKPSVEEIVRVCYEMMTERNPSDFPSGI